MRTLHVLPTTDRADELLGQLAADRPLSAVVGRHVITFDRLENELAASALDGKRRLDDVTRALLVETVLAAREWTPFEAVVHRRGFRRCVELFLAEVAHGGARFDELTRVARRLPGPLAQRVSTLASIGRVYLETLSHRGLVDPQFALSVACERLTRGGPLPDVLDEIDELHFHDVLDWRPGRLRLLSAVATALKARGGRVVVTLPRSERPELAEVLEPALHAIESLEAPVEVQSIAVGVRAPVQAFDAADDEGERREVAGRVASLLAQGASPGDVVVAMRGIQEASAALHRALSARGVPVRNRRGRRLTGSRVVRLALLVCRLDRPTVVTRAKVASLVGSSLVDLRGLSESAPSPAQMARHLREAAVRSRVHDGDGRDGFDARLERLANALARDGKEHDAARVQRTRAAIAALFQRLDRWPAKATRARHARELVSLLEALRLPARLRRLGFGTPTGLTHQPGDDERLQAGLLAFEQASWTAMTQAARSLAQAAEALGLGDEKVSRSDFAAALEERCGAESLRTGLTRGAAVELVEPGDLAGRSVPHVFFVGADADALPGPSDDQTLLADDERRLLNKALGRAVFRTTPAAGDASVLPSRQLLRAADAVLAFAAATGSLTLSHARADARGRPLAPSALWAVAGTPQPVSLPFVPLDPRLGARRTADIEARQEASLARARFFADGSLNEWSGDLSRVRSHLEEKAPGTQDRPLSAGALETFAACAFRWFGTRTLHLDGEADGSQTASPLESGKLAHAALEAAVRAVVKANLWDHTRMTEALSVGIAAAVAKLDELEPVTVVGHPQLRAVDRERLLRRLAHLLPKEIETTAEAGLTPRDFELGFGLPGASLPAFELAGVKLSGRVDRLDVGASGAQVIDYKSGSADSNARKLSKDRLLEMEFQLPLYVAALKALAPGLEGRFVDAAYISLRSGERSKTLTQALSEPFDDAIARLGEAASQAVEAIREGRLPPAPKSCDFCELRPVCRIPRPVRST